ncbi:MAG TPA: prepilin-type N-terminal cleavage/methylation domain-containing protein [Chthoniobacteraceae bacterium]|nr:prepilin-type N-terminal cleavage/methylation domain-containing protein [Chthoniobacteraceae bacterium]
MKKSAFTLIELLVVISIIAILASIAMPVFSKVLERGKVTSDGNNLHQLGIGIQAYMADNDDQLFSASGSSGATGTWPVTLHDKYVTNWKTFLSPFDKRPPKETGNIPVSYAINKNCFGVNAAKFNSPSQLIVMAPNVNRSGDVAFSGTSSESPLLSMPGAGTKAGTHNGRSQINALFADTHVENMNYKKYADTSSAEGAQAWYPTGQAQ